jgi:hypothetical protein
MISGTFNRSSCLNSEPLRAIGQFEVQTNVTLLNGQMEQENYSNTGFFLSTLPAISF